MIPPPSRPDMPSVRVPKGAFVHVHLAVAPRSATVSVDGRAVAVKLDRVRRLLSWRAGRFGIVDIEIKATGSAGYLAILRRQ